MKNKIEFLKCIISDNFYKLNGKHKMDVNDNH